jgi:hypothetical protein
MTTMHTKPKKCRGQVRRKKRLPCGRTFFGPGTQCPRCSNGRQDYYGFIEPRRCCCETITGRCPLDGQIHRAMKGAEKPSDSDIQK